MQISFCSSTLVDHAEVTKPLSGVTSSINKSLYIQQSRWATYSLSYQYHLSKKESFICLEL